MFLQHGAVQIVEVSALDTPQALRGPSALLRLQTDERLVTLTRRGNQSAYEALVKRYEARLLSFCRHMLHSKEDAEDVLQEVFANAFNAIMGDTRAINVRPWLYRIARNRCLNHLRRIQPIGVDTLDDQIGNRGLSAADTAQHREDFRELLADVRALPESQRTALLLREIDALSYDQMAEALDTTVPSVKSLLVRARVGLAEAAEARGLTCEEVRDEVGLAAEELRRVNPAFRRHLKECDRCSAFQAAIKANNKALRALSPLGPLLLLKKLLANLSAGIGASGGAAATGVAATGISTGIVSTGVTAVATKAAAGLAAAALITAGAVDVRQTSIEASEQSPAAPKSKELVAEIESSKPFGLVDPRAAATDKAKPTKQTIAAAATTSAENAKLKTGSTESNATTSPTTPGTTSTVGTISTGTVGAVATGATVTTPTATTPPPTVGTTTTQTSVVDTASQTVTMPDAGTSSTTPPPSKATSGSGSSSSSSSAPSKSPAPVFKTGESSSSTGSSSKR